MELFEGNTLQRRQVKEQVAFFRTDEAEAFVRELLNRPLSHLSKYPLNPPAGRDW